MDKYSQLEAFLTFVHISALVRMSIILIGVIGNILTIIIFSRKVFQKNSIGMYCRALAIAENAMIVQLIWDICSNFWNIDFRVISSASCKFYYYTQSVFSPISAWILVAFSLDKMINVSSFHNKFKFIRKKKFQLGLITAIVIIHCIAYIEIPILIDIVQVPVGYGSNDTSPACDLQYTTISNAVTLLSAIEAVLIPFLIMLLSSIVTIRSIVMSRKNLENNREGRLSERKSRDKKFAINSIVFNVLFLIFKTPLALVNYIPVENYFTYLYFVSITALLYYANYSMNFFVHFSINSIFRKECLIILRIRKQFNGTRVEPSHTGQINYSTSILRVKPPKSQLAVIDS